MTPFDHTTRRLAVLLVAPEVSRRDNLAVVGHAEPRISDSESVDYAELLSANNYHFDIITPDEIHRQLLAHNNSLNYSSIVLAVPLSQLTASALALIRELSHDAGISLIATYDHPDERSAAFFGIERFKGTRMLWPLKAKIIQWPHEATRDSCVADYGLRSGFAGVRRRGLRRLSWKQTFTKGLSLVRSLRLPYVAALPASDARVLLTTMRDEPLAWSYRFGSATNYYFALHGNLFLDKYNEIHRLVRSVIEANSGHGMVSVDLERTMVVRLDDPGASKADYLNNGQLLNESDWNELGRIIKEKKIALSVMYTPGWVDDGDAQAGSLFVDNEPVMDRPVGELYSCARVRYVFADRHKGEHDHSSEFKGLEALSSQHLVDVHSHGLTHLVPDYEAWAAAEDKRTDVRWYTEFYDTRANRRVADDAQIYALVRSKNAIEDLFHIAPTAITPSGHRHDSTCDILAHGVGYKLFSADYTGIIKKGLLIRNWKIPAVVLFFKEPSSSVSKAGYPVIGIVHDYEIKGRLDQLSRLIDRWSNAGIRRFISMNDLAVSLCCSIDARYSKQESSISVDIIFSPVVRSDGLSCNKTEIVVRVALPLRSSCERERIEARGATVVSLEQSMQNTISLLMRVIDSETMRIIIPVSYE